ncbi:hypothetical protein BSL78_16074 [Apostichopus japonicus]|uniref:Uncharacterized protein n=1 Tax=Stichopus japonicus TaxID=307972 RepID=A0A2G8KGF0_STIJA|nr:hypothetical protein BSL78_16074 [Apostichopus japonicus]
MNNITESADTTVLGRDESREGAEEILVGMLCLVGFIQVAARLAVCIFVDERGGSSMKDYLSEIFLLMALLTLFLLFVVTCADAVALKFYRLMGLLIWLSLMVAIS